MNHAIVFTVEHGRDVVYSRSCVWRAQLYDVASEQFYAGGSDVSAWDAIAWALAEREVRITNGNRPVMSRGFGETPESWIARVNAQRAVFDHIIATDPYVKAEIDDRVAAALDAVTTENGTIQRSNRLDAPVIEPKKPAAARRARARKG